MRLIYWRVETRYGRITLWLCYNSGHIINPFSPPPPLLSPPLGIPCPFHVAKNWLSKCFESGCRVFPILFKMFSFETLVFATLDFVTNFSQSWKIWLQCKMKQCADFCKPAIYLFFVWGQFTLWPRSWS